jgi:hypothetical protein
MEANIAKDPWIKVFREFQHDLYRTGIRSLERSVSKEDSAWHNVYGDYVKKASRFLTNQSDAFGPKWFSKKVRFISVSRESKGRKPCEITGWTMAIRYGRCGVAARKRRHENPWDKFVATKRGEMFFRRLRTKHTVVM